MTHRAGIVSRREALGVMGAAAGTALVAPERAAAELRGANATPLVFMPACIVTPSQTEGPYFVDEKLERADIRLDPTDGAVREGLQLALRLSVYRVDGQTCAPLTGAHVDLWQCDAAGIYSDVLDSRGRFDTRNRRFLRGYQVSGAHGTVDFLTVYPGWYPGRTPHIHFKIRLFAGARRTFEFTSQLYFDESVTDKVHAQAPYRALGPRDTRNGRDGIFRNEGGDRLLIAMDDRTDRLRGNFDIGLRLT